MAWEELAAAGARKARVPEREERIGTSTEYGSSRGRRASAVLRAWPPEGGWGGRGKEVARCIVSQV